MKKMKNVILVILAIICLLFAIFWLFGLAVLLGYFGGVFSAIIVLVIAGKKITKKHIAKIELLEERIKESL
jgi:amino acid permease